MRVSWLAVLGVLASCRFERPADIGEEDARVIDAAIDADPGPPGGDALAQLTFTGSITYPSAIATSDGGVALTFFYSGGAPLHLADTTVPCTLGQVLVKLDDDLGHVDWYAYIGMPVIREARLATSPNGSLYWGLEATGDDPYTLQIDGSAFAASIAIPVAGASDQGQAPGGARVVVALTSEGAPRWHHALAQTDTTVGHYLAPFSVFAASDDAVLSSFAFTKGTLSFTGSAGAMTMPVTTPSFVLHELDPASGRTRQLLLTANNVARTQYVVGTSITGFAGKGFALQAQDIASTGDVTGNKVSIGSLGNGSFVERVTYATVDPQGQVLNVVPVRHGTGAAAFAPITTTLTVGTQTFTAPARSGDALFMDLDPTSVTPRGSVMFGGSGADRPTHLVDVGNGDLYGIGSYVSSDLSIGGMTLAAPSDILAPGIFVARLVLQDAALVPVWSRGYVSSTALTPFGAAADHTSGDLYLFGQVGGTVDFGLGPITATTFVVKIRRGGF